MPWVITEDDRNRSRLRRKQYAERACVIVALENEGMKTPADGAAIARLSRRLCEIEDALGMEKEQT